MQEVEIYFNESLHKYTDNFNNTYTSVTTVIGEYENKFSDKQLDIAKACERIGKNPAHPKYNKYKGQSASDILKSWDKTRVEACDIGNTKHNYLELSVKSATGFFTLPKVTSGKIFTVNDINLGFGKLDISVFNNTGVKDTYPEIYEIICNFVNAGWDIYAEICTYDYDKLIAGLIDILFIKGNKFVILDWKTNKNKIRFESGYYDKDDKGNSTEYIITEEYLKYPLSSLPQSVGIKYSLQLSLYAYLNENLGLECAGLILCHILHDFYTAKDAILKKNHMLVGCNKVDIYSIKYMKNEVSTMINHFSINRSKEKVQYLMFNK
jgi:hypothetical protein